MSSPNYFRIETNTKEGMVQLSILSHATRPFIAKICVSSKDHKKIIQVNRFFSSAFIIHGMFVFSSTTACEPSISGGPLPFLLFWNF